MSLQNAGQRETAPGERNKLSATRSNFRSVYLSRSLRTRPSKPRRCSDWYGHPLKPFKKGLRSSPSELHQSFRGTNQLAQIPNTSTMRSGPERPGNGSEEIKQLLLSAAESVP